MGGGRLVGDAAEHGRQGLCAGVGVAVYEAFMSGRLDLTCADAGQT